MLKVACRGPGVSRTCSLSVTSLILYHYTSPAMAVCSAKFCRLSVTVVVSLKLTRMPDNIINSNFLIAVG